MDQETYEHYLLMSLGFKYNKNENCYYFDNFKLIINYERESPYFVTSDKPIYDYFGETPLFEDCVDDFKQVLSIIINKTKLIEYNTYDLVVERKYEKEKINYSVTKRYKQQVSVDPELEQMCKDFFSEHNKNVHNIVANCINDKIIDLE